MKKTNLNVSIENATLKGVKALNLPETFKNTVLESIHKGVSTSGNNYWGQDWSQSWSEAYPD